MQQQVVFGGLAGIEEHSVEIDVGRGQVKVYPRGELDISLEWVFSNMGKRVMCLLHDGKVVEIKGS
jgi:hypothetical protein